MVELIKKIAKERGLKVIDLYTRLKMHPEVFPDACHPNADGAAIMARTTGKHVLEAKLAGSEP